jgi:glucose/arabinose dehydrogenase
MARRHRPISALSAALLLAVVASGTGTSSAAAAAAPTEVATNLQIPWSIAYLPDGSALATERATARILSISPTGEVKTVQTLAEVSPRGEGGLLGLALSPSFQTDNTIFVYYTTSSDNRIAKMRLGESPQPIVTGIPAANVHNGGRIAFGPDGHLYAGTGDAGVTSNSQNLNSLGGKILRVTTTGAAAPGNPFTNSRVWSYGHRNVQGFAWDSAGRMYASEFGQNTFDELNRIEAGKNYGWPTVEGSGSDPKFVNPLVTWTTAQASPSGITIRGNDVYVACLRGEKIFRVRLGADGAVVGQPEALFSGQFGRLRHVAVDPKGALVTLTSNRDGRGSPRPGDDKIIRLDDPTPPGPGTNLALNKPAKSSQASCNANESPAKAVNGTASGNSDKWCSGVTGPKSLEVDLGTSKALTRFVVKHAGAGGEPASLNTKNFTLETSAGGGVWTTAATVTNNTASTTTHPVSVSARWIRITTTDPIARIYEFEAY